MENDKSHPDILGELIETAEKGEEESLIALDAIGLPFAPGEKLPDYIKRLHCLQKRLQDFTAKLENEEEYQMEDLTLRKEDRIPVDLLRRCTEVTKQKYGFQIDWVPAFFINPSFSWLFGGCAYYDNQNIFALMIIRKSFAKREKWFIYRRSEILAHEMCHVARLSLQSTDYEERFAYRISESRFRRRLGGVFESPRDSFLLLGSTLLLLAGQCWRVGFAQNMPIWPFWSLVGGVFAFLFTRDARRHRTLRRAMKNLESLRTETWSEAVLFRCSDQEIKEIAAFKNKDELNDWIKDKKDSAGWRWRIIEKRFYPS